MSHGRRAALEWSLVALGGISAFALLPHALGNDDAVRFADIEGLLHHGTLSDSKYSLVMPLVSAPFLLLGELIGSPSWWAAHFNVLVLVGAALVSVRLLRGRVDPELLRGTLLVLVFASYLTNRLRDYNAEVLTASLAAVGLIAVCTGRGRTLGRWAIVVGVVNTPAAIAGLAALSTADAVRARRLRRLWPVAAAALLIGAEAWLRRGSPFDTGYGNDHGYATVLPYSGRPGFSYPFLFGVVSILFSFGRGLVFFMPGLLLWLSRGSRALLGRPARHATAAMLLFTAGLVLVYAKWWAWYGGAAFGPRFFLFAALPASILLAARLRRPSGSFLGDVGTLAVLVLSVWVAVVGILASAAPPELCTRDLFAYESLCWYTPELSPLGNPFVSFPHVSTAPLLAALLCVAVAAYLAAPTAVAAGRRLAETAARLRLSDWRV